MVVLSGDYRRCSQMLIDIQGALGLRLVLRALFLHVRTSFTSALPAPYVAQEPTSRAAKNRSLKG